MSTRALLASIPEVEVVYTRDDAILRGSLARWFPNERTIAFHSDARGKAWRCSATHEIAHAVLGHPAACGNEFFDNQNEIEADKWAARVLLPDLEKVATEIATAASYGQAAYNLGVILDLLEVRLHHLTDDERRHVSRRVWSVHDGCGR